MAVKKKVAPRVEEESLKVSSVKRRVPVLTIISTTFYITWIVIGILVMLLMFANFKQGAFDGVFAPRPSPQAVPDAPTETDIPGIGKVNISCVQQNLSSDAIQKIVTTGDSSQLTEDEKKALDQCISEKEVAPTPSPAG